MMLLWAATQKDFKIWTNALFAMKNLDKAEASIRQDLIVKQNSKNAFVTTLYKWLRP